MTSWTETEWIPVERKLPTGEDGPPLLLGAKVGVFVLTVEMLINGTNPEARGFHLQAGLFDDDEADGLQRVMFWAPCWNESEFQSYGDIAEPVH